MFNKQIRKAIVFWNLKLCIFGISIDILIKKSVVVLALLVTVSISWEEEETSLDKSEWACANGTSEIHACGAREPMG
jgi:hypothetical protein